MITIITTLLASKNLGIAQLVLHAQLFANVATTIYQLLVAACILLTWRDKDFSSLAINGLQLFLLLFVHARLDRGHDNLPPSPTGAWV